MHLSACWTAASAAQNHMLIPSQKPHFSPIKFLPLRITQFRNSAFEFIFLNISQYVHLSIVFSHAFNVFFLWSQNTRIVSPAQMLEMETISVLFSSVQPLIVTLLSSPASSLLLSTYQRSPSASIGAGEEAVATFAAECEGGETDGLSHLLSPSNLCKLCLLPTIFLHFVHSLTDRHTQAHARARTGVTNALSDAPLLAAAIRRSLN